jgi:hypothetical protein
MRGRISNGTHGKDGEFMTWKEGIAALALGVATVLSLVFVDHGSPMWLRVSAAVLLTAVIVAPALPFLALIPWHFIALHRGLIRRSRVPCVVSVSQGAIQVERGDRSIGHTLDAIVRARFAQNDNWTESKILDDALGLFTANGIEIERLPRSAAGFDELLVELRARGIPIEDVYVSAPAVFD